MMYVAIVDSIRRIYSGELLDKIYNRLVIGTFLIIPLVFYDGMKWSFHTPRYMLLNILVLLLLFVHTSRTRSSLNFGHLDFVLMAYTLYVILHATSSGFGGDLYNRVDVLVYLIIFYVLVQQLNTHTTSQNEIIAQVFIIISVTGLVLAIYGILQFFHLDVFRDSPYPSAETRVIGTMVGGNSLGIYLSIATLTCVYNLHYSKSRLRLGFFLSAIGIILWALILTLSRGAWLSLLVGSMVIALSRIKLFWNRVFTRNISKASALIALGAILSILMWQAYELNPASVRGRFFVWRISSHMFLDHPMLGMGYGRFEGEYLNYQADFFDSPQHSVYFNNAGNLKGASNEYIQVLVENGILGFALILIAGIVFFSAIRYIISSADQDEKLIFKVLLAILTTVGIHALVDEPLNAPAIAVVVFFSLGMISLKMKNNIAAHNKEYSSPKFVFQKSFEHNIFLRVATLIILLYGTYYAVRTASGYIHWQNGQALAASNYWMESIEEYEMAHAILPRDAELSVRLGSAYAYTRQPERALELLLASEGRYNDWNMHIVKGFTLMQLNRLEEAENSFKIAIRMYPKLLLPRLWLAEMYLTAGRKEESISRLNEIIAIQPKIMTAEAVSIKEDAKRLLRFVEDEE